MKFQKIYSFFSNEIGCVFPIKYKDTEAINRLEASIRGKNIIKNFFDVWLCYHEQDFNEVEYIARQLREKEIQVWLNEWQVAAGEHEGMLLNNELQERRIWSVAVFIGSKGGSWLNKRSVGDFIWDFHDRERPIIPIYLMSVQQNSEEAEEEAEQDVPVYIRRYTSVDFRQDKNPIEKLYWGITGEKWQQEVRIPQFEEKHRLS